MEYEFLRIDNHELSQRFWDNRQEEVEINLKQFFDILPRTCGLCALLFVGYFSFNLEWNSIYDDWFGWV